MLDIDTQVLQQAAQWQRDGIPAWLVTVARTWGSSPRPPGALMALNGRGEVAGSMSGGCIEDDLVARARAGVAATARPEVLRYGVHADQARQFGLPCGGTLELVMETIGPASQLPALLEHCRRRDCIERELDLASGAVSLRPGPADGLPRLTADTFTSHFGPSVRLIVIGAGDTSGYLCQIALTLGFEVIVCDPRDTPSPAWTMPGAVRSREMPDDLILRLRPDRRTAIIALSHDPKLDDLALIDALPSQAFYVGAIGSRRNSETRRARLREHFDLADADLRRLRGPAGVYIGSKTPAEIALSIMAEIVAAKNGVARDALETVAAGKARDPAKEDRAREGPAGLDSTLIDPPHPARACPV